jgi:hypothetical protein
MLHGIILLVITVDFKEYSTVKVFLMIFGFIKINFFYSLNITITFLTNNELIPESAIFQLLCDFSPV